MTVRILGIGGTTRSASTSELALDACLLFAEQFGAETVKLTASELMSLPLYNPDSARRSRLAERLIDEVRQADGLVIASPGYHGAMSGLIKNTLDYFEDLRSDDPPYLDGKAVGCIATAYGWQAGVGTLVSLRGVVHSLRGWPSPLGAALNSAGKLFDSQGNCTDDRAASQLKIIAKHVTDFACLRRAGEL